MIDSVGYIIVTVGLPDPQRLFTRPYIYVCAPHVRTDPCPRKSPCYVEAMLIVLRLLLPRIAPFLVRDEVLARDRVY